MKKVVSALLSLAGLVAGVMAGPAAFSQTRARPADYALVLKDAPVAQKFRSRAAIQSAAAQSHLRRKIRSCPNWRGGR